MGTVRPAPIVYLRVQQATDAQGRGLITEWLSRQGEARAKFHTRLKYFAKIPRADLNKKQFRHIEDGIWEIKWEAGNKQWRALGFDHAEWFVMVLGCTHKDGVYDPRDWKKSAKNRRDETVRGERIIISYDVT